jgi:hypothetical protein
MKSFVPLEDKQLIKDEENFSSDTVVMVGNGALVNGWMPLRHVLDEWIQKDKLTHSVIKKLRVQNSEAMHQLGGLSYKFKIARGAIYKQWIDKKLTPRQTFEAGLGGSIQEFLTIREKVSQEYTKASDDLVLNINDSIWNMIGARAVFITTNWDNALWLDDRVKRAIYLHGRCDFSESLVFPTELIIEDIAYDCDRLLSLMHDCSHEFKDTMLKTFRCLSVDALLNAHSTASRLINQARRVIIWGYSLGDFDADINAIIGNNINREETRELIVINTDPYAFQRAVALTGLTQAWHFNPYLGSTLKLDI